MTKEKLFSFGEENDELHAILFDETLDDMRPDWPSRAGIKFVRRTRKSKSYRIFCYTYKNQYVMGRAKRVTEDEMTAVIHWPFTLLIDRSCKQRALYATLRQNYRGDGWEMFRS